MKTPREYDSSFEILEEMRTGRGRNANPINFARAFLLLATIAAFIFALTGCTTETTRTITTDKAGTVTDTTVTKKGTDPAALKLVSVAAEVYLPRRPIVIREEKSDRDMRRLLEGRKITELEIAFRYRKP